jgi:23S rRNA U2552 (ribose-2'-O)-methylase RlmE/FtsJ
MYQFPTVAVCPNFNVSFSSGVEEHQSVVSQALSRYLAEIKQKMNDKEREWDIYKKYTNTYEYIHTVISHKKRSVSKYRPLSRSYFKMIELIQQFNLCSSDEPMQSFHLAEGPGGFIEATANMRCNMNDRYTGMTLIDTVFDASIPSWKKSSAFLNANPQTVSIETGYDGTGNIMSIQNFDYCAKKYGGRMAFITGDGGFDFTTCFDDQEIKTLPLIFAQTCFAIAMQRQGGNFVLKIFDVFTPGTIDVLYLLSCAYSETYICKPQTSRTANSERYVVCKGFIPGKIDIDELRRAFISVVSRDETYDIERVFFGKSISSLFISKVEEYNAILGQQQLENIHQTLSLIDKFIKPEKIEQMTKQNIAKCINWCVRHQVPYNSITTNIFSTKNDEPYKNNTIVEQNASFS